MKKKYMSPAAEETDFDSRQMICASPQALLLIEGLTYDEDKGTIENWY